MAVNVHSGEIGVPASAVRMLWAVAEAPKEAGRPSGDGFLLMRDRDRVIFAVADGAGSGSEARIASNLCLDVLSRSNAADLARVFDDCHRHLIGTRGAALAVAVVDLDRQTVVWAAVGDIDGAIFPEPRRKTPLVSVIQRPGTLGHNKPGISPQRHKLGIGQMVSMSTDGVSREYRDQRGGASTPVDFVSTRLDRYGREGDDRTLAAFALDRGRP